MLNFKVNYTSAKKVEEALRGLGEALGPLEQNRILRKIAAEYLADTEKRFVSQSDPDRKKWKPLRPATIEVKKRKGSLMGPTHIGVWTGKLASSLQYRISGDTAYIGSNVPYAPWFHYGHKQGWGPTPSRRFLGRNTRIDQKILRLYESEIAKIVGLNIFDFKSAV